MRNSLVQSVRNQWPVSVWFMVYLCIAGALQWYTSYPWDSDTAYHFAVGKLLRQYGILHTFPWTPFSWFSDNYADDKLIFHLLFVPLANLDYVTASRIVGTLAGAVILFVLYLILRAERVRYAGLWAAAPLASSVLFIFRFVQVRPSLLSISLALFFLWAAGRGRLKSLAVVSAIFPWAYIAFWQIPVLLLLASETASFLAGRNIQWKPVAVTAAGIAFGVATHPNAANLLAYNWLTMSEILFRNAWMTKVGFDMGAELAPYPLGGWIQGLSINVLMTGTAALFAWRSRKGETVALAFALAAIGFCALTMKSARFAEYFVPFSVAAMALSSRSINWRLLAPVMVGASLIFTVVVGNRSLAGLAKLEEEMDPQVASTLQQVIPKGAQVFTTGWQYTGLLMLTLPERYFMVALDPTFFYKKDPELYRLWYQLTHDEDPPPGTAEIIRQRFGARYVIVDNPQAAKKFNFRLFFEPGVRVLVNSAQWMAFDLGLPKHREKADEHENIIKEK